MHIAMSGDGVLHYTHVHRGERVTRTETLEKFIKLCKRLEKTSSVFSVRCCGQFRMAPVIVAILEAGIRLEICSPELFAAATRDVPASLLRVMTNSGPNVSPSLGGYHVANDLDLATARLSTALINNAPASTLAELYQQHPLYKPLSFFLGLADSVVGAIIGYVRDPRWFVDIDKPSRHAKFARFFGLFPERVDMIRKIGPKTPAGYRTQLMMMSWCASENQAAAALQLGGTLYRLQRRNPDRWLLTGSRKFATILYYLWTDVAARHEGRSKHHEPLFDPNMVIVESDVAYAFSKHLADCFRDVAV